MFYDVCFLCICRNALITIEENLALRGLVQVFTSCFLQIRAAQRPQVSATPFCHLLLEIYRLFNLFNDGKHK